MNERAVRDRLVEYGRKLFDAEREKLIEFTGDPAADALLNDLGTADVQSSVPNFAG